MIDVAEIFFNIDKFSQFLKIHHWNSGRIENLKNAVDPQHRLLGETLDLFVDADKKNGNVYNLGAMDDVFILEYTGPGAPAFSSLNGHIIGATSPNTIFFTPAGDLSYVSNTIHFVGNDSPFDGDFNPLYNRDREFIKYMAYLRTFPGFRANFEEVDNYIQATINYCNSQDYNFGAELAAINANSVMNYENIVTPDGCQIFVAGNIPLMKKATDISQIKLSEFMIKPTRNINEDLPIVLPIDNSCKGLKFISAPWDCNITVPDFDPAPLNQRLLPDVRIQYPYLTLGDFLEPVLIHTAFDGHSSLANEYDFEPLGESGTLNQYLLPIKKEFFKYFSVQDLRRNMTVSEAEDHVTVSIKIPIRGNQYTHDITYTKIYQKDKEPINTRKFGKIESINYSGITIFPHVKPAVGGSLDYRVTLFEDPQITAEWNPEDRPALKFFKGDASFVNVCQMPIIRNINREGDIIDKYTPLSKTWVINNDEFDLIELSFGSGLNKKTNLIVPKFASENNTKEFSFAIDFGTTNTHIEYSVDGSEPKAFDISAEDAQIRPNEGLNTDASFRKVIDGDLVPTKLGTGQDVMFPMRTALSYRKGSDWQKDMFAFADANVPFYYGKKVQPGYNESPLTNLKWEKGDNNAQAQTKCYFECLAYIMRNKVVMNGGDLTKTKFIWFYPTSMGLKEIGKMKTLWNEVYEQYFKGDVSTNVFCVPEAVAPLSYYRQASTDAITIDIGGGTSDFTFAADKKVECISSARFASNSLFGDGLNGEPLSSGFVNHFIDRFESEVAEYGELLQVMHDIKQGKSASTNLISYFFSLKDNAAITDNTKRNNIDFTRMLEASPECNFIILTFYMSLIYYSAHILKAKGLKEPRYIGFSGNGSKVLNIFLKDTSEVVADLTKRMIEKVIGHTYDSDGLDILRSNSNTPKEATCKGGLKILEKIVSDGKNVYDGLFVDKHEGIWLGIDDKSIKDETHKLNKSIATSDYDGVVSMVNDFVEKLFKVLEEGSASKYLELPTNLGEIKSMRVFSQDLIKYVKDGISRDKLDPESEISSTYFFYPIEGIIHRLANELLKN